MGNRGSKLFGHGFWTKHDVIVAIATACATMATRWVCREFDAESCDSVETVAQSRRIGGQQSLGHGFWTKHDVIVAITTACDHLWLPAGFVGNSMLNHCDSDSETSWPQRGIGLSKLLGTCRRFGQNMNIMCCP